MLKKEFLDYKIKMKLEATTTTVIKNELKYSPMPKGNASVAEPNLDVLSLREFSKELV